jgi:hypothetical protein
VRKSATSGTSSDFPITLERHGLLEALNLGRIRQRGRVDPVWSVGLRVLACPPQ